MTGPVIDRAYIELLPSSTKLMPAIKADVDKAMNGIKTSVSNASKSISDNAAKSGAGIGTGAKAGATAAAGHLTGLQNTAKNIFGKIKSAGTEAFGALGGKQIAGLLAVGGIIEFGKKSIASFEGVVSSSLKMQRIMGGTVQSASAWAGGMKLAGISTDSFAMAAKKMSQTIVAAGASPGAGPFHDLGINVRDAQGHLKSMDQLLPVMADKFKAMPAGAEKTALAVKIFGRTGLEMLPMLNRGSAGLEMLRKKAQELGITIGDKQVAQFKKSVAIHREFQARMQGLQVTIGEHLLPVVDFFYEALNNFLFPAMGKVGQAVHSAVDAFKSFGEWADRNKNTILIVAGAITAFLLPSLIRMAAQAAISIGESIALWVLYGTAAVVNAVKAVGAFLLVNVKQIATAAQATVSFGIMVAKWVWMGVQATIQAGRTAGAFVIVTLAQLRAQATAEKSIAIMVAKWAWMAVQAAFNAAKVAAAWLVASGPIGWVALGIAALGTAAIIAGNKLGWFGDQATKAAMKGVKDLTTSMKDSGGVFDDNAKKILANTLVQGGWIDKAAKAHISAEELTRGVTGTDEEFKKLTDTWKAQGKPSNDTIFNLKRIHDGLDNATESGKKHADQSEKQAKQTDQVNKALGVESDQLQETNDWLKQNNLTVDTATKKYNDAVKEAHSFTAELGYMQKALDTLSNNQINATLGQLHLADAWDTGTKADSELTRQVHDHGGALQGNTADTRSNREWLLNQILAINNQAVSYAQSTGKIGAGTDSLTSNKNMLIEATKRAGLNQTQVQDMINTYMTTPGKITTSIEKQGDDAVIEKLGEIENMLHRIARPDWAANVDFLANNTSMPLGGVAPSSQAAGGPVPPGGRGPRADDMLIRASTGEFVVNAVAYARNKSIINAINAGAKFDRYADGGPVFNPGRIGNLNGPAVFNRGVTGNSLGPNLNGRLTMTFADKMVAVALLEGQYKNLFTGAVKQYLSSLLTSPAHISADVAAEQQYAASLFRFYNWGADQLPSLINLWNGESGWDPGALNASSGAYGIPQSLPADKMASAGPDWRTNAATQIRWGVNYINDVYGSPAAAWGAWLARSPHWYGNGLDPTVFHRPTLIGVGDRGAETVSVTPGDARGRNAQLMMVELGPRSVAAIAAAVTRMVIEMDGRQVATVVTKYQELRDRNGVRR